MKFAELLTEDLILFDLKASNKWEAIGALLDLLVKNKKIRPENKKIIYDALAARENIASTGLEHGVAIPHASVDVIDEAVAAFAVVRQGVPFQSTDGKPAKLIILLVIPRKSVQKHVATLTCIARLLNYEEMRETILNATTPSEVMNIVREEEAKQ